MSTRLKPLAVALCLSSISFGTTYALADTNNDSNNNKALAQQLAELQNEVNSLKQQLQVNAPVQAAHHKARHKRMKHNATKHNHTEGGVAVVDDDLEDNPHALRGRDLIRMIREEKEYLPFDLDVPGQAFVSTGPYVGVPLQYSGSNLVINAPSVNIDVQLLSIRKSIHKQLMAMGGEIFKEPYHSHLLFSGVFEGQADYANFGGSPSTTNIDVTNVSLDAFFLGPSEWVLGFIEFSYDGNPPVSNHVFLSTSNYTDSNSRLFVNKAFATVGNFSESPFYGSFGQFYVPFGAYSSMMVSNTFTKVLTRTKARAFLIGMQQQDSDCAGSFYSAAYIFRGDSHAASVSKINNGGINLGYKYKYGVLNGNFGGGIIANIADSGGMQIGTGFNSYEQISHRVPGANLRGVFGLGDHLSFITEYVGATTAFNPNDMSYNGHGAKPWAFDVEGAYTFTILCDKPSTVAIGYQKSTEALAMGLPMTRYSAVLTTSLLRNTLQSLEFRHDRNYAAGNVANGPVGNTVPGTCNALTCTQTGKGDNVITASFDYYF